MLNKYPNLAIFVFVTIALVQPLLGMLGVYDDVLLRPLGPVLITLLVGVVWYVIATAQRLQDPVEGLAICAVIYAMVVAMMDLLGTYRGAFRLFSDSVLVYDVMVMAVVYGGLGALCGFLVQRSITGQTSRRRKAKTS